MLLGLFCAFIGLLMMLGAPIDRRWQRETAQRDAAHDACERRKAARDRILYPPRRSS